MSGQGGTGVHPAVVINITFVPLGGQGGTGVHPARTSPPAPAPSTSSAPAVMSEKINLSGGNDASRGLSSENAKAQSECRPIEINIEVPCCCCHDHKHGKDDGR